MKKLTAILLALTLMLTLALPVSAAEAGAFLHAGYAVTEDALVCLGSELPSDGVMTVTLGAQEDVEGSFATVSEAGLRSTVYCLVDTAKTLSARQMEQQKKILYSISGKMGADDIMVIAQIGETLTESGPLTTTAQRKAAIDALERSDNVTNLYHGVVKSIESLATRTDLSLHRSLVVLSNGVNDGHASTTEQEALDAIAASRLPVYGVAVLDDGAGQWSQNQAKPVQRFVDASVGGIHFSAAATGISEEDTAASIWRSIQNSTVIMVELDSIEKVPGQDAMMLMARYEVGTSKYEDSLTILSVDIPDAAPADPDPSGEPEATGETEPPAEVAEEAGFPLWIVIAIVAAVVVVAVVVVLVTKKKKKAAPQSEETINIKLDNVTETVPVPNNAPAVPPTVPSKPALEDGCKVSLTIIGQASHSYSFFIPVSQRKSVGRNPSKCDIVLNQTDTQLSGQHCILEWDGRRLAACDVSTYNSTCVNGVRVQPHVWMNLENGATLRMGACDYRVKLEPGIQ